MSSVCGMELEVVYGPAKGAAVQIARTMAVDYARDNILVNAVCPRIVETQLLRRTAVESVDPEKFLVDLAAASPNGRNAQPDEVVRFIRFLASDHVRFFPGSVLTNPGRIRGEAEAGVVRHRGQKQVDRAIRGQALKQPKRSDRRREGSLLVHRPFLRR
jgi:NAD(P)-dependent dehydrogenase (short-subunit alcohol dehydrogenase family)